MRTKTILLVDDDSDSLLICRTILSYHGYGVLEAGDGAEGVRLARDAQPDLILMDLILPVLDGWAATERLKIAPETRAIPVVALTARALDLDRAWGERVGCAGYLTKPCPPQRVVDEVRRLVGAAAA